MTVNPREAVREIRARVVREMEHPQRMSTSFELWNGALTRLRVSFDDLYRIRSLVGRMPPSPNTLRAKAGGYLVRILQRLLFWYTPQILRFHQTAVEVLGHISEFLEMSFQSHLTLAASLEQTRREIGFSRAAALAREIRLSPGGIDGKSGTGSSHSSPSSKAARDAFAFAFQNRFRGSETEVRAKLQVYVDSILGLKDPPPQGQWLDLGCGRGEWLSAAARLSPKIMGIDSSCHAITHCRQAGLEVTLADALEFLGQVGNDEVAVISAFHVVEHVSFDYLLALVAEAARVLKPGGLLIIETPHAGNLLMGSHHFWLDPTHQRPVPVNLMEFVLEYCGFRIAKRLEVNPMPEPARLPFSELPFVRQLNEHLYGNQDYGLIGRR